VGAGLLQTKWDSEEKLPNIAHLGLSFSTSFLTPKGVSCAAVLSRLSLRGVKSRPALDW